jgi:hypothetical protein
MFEKFILKKKKEKESNKKEEKKIENSKNNDLKKEEKKILEFDSFKIDGVIEEEKSEKKEEKSELSLNDLLYIDKKALDIIIFDELKRNLKKLIMQLKENIENDKYDVLLGDDASGRIPTLILREVINKVKERVLGEKEKIETKFIAGGKGIQWEPEKIEKAKELFKKMNLEGKKVLVVTEYMGGGEGLWVLIKVLSKYVGSNFDCAVLASGLKKKDYMFRFSDFKEDNLFIAYEKKPPSSVYGEYGMGGVKKEDKLDVLAKRQEDVPQWYINFNRKLVKDVAEEIFEEIWGKELKKKNKIKTKIKNLLS